MLRRFIHDLQLPATLLQQPGGERRLTNLLHLAELLQRQPPARWRAGADPLAGRADRRRRRGGDERVLRLESDAELVKVVTVHKSKGLEYPLVYLPFAVTARKVERRNRSFFEFSDTQGVRQIDMALTDEALALVEQARLQEDLRLLYVALTRARHFLWLGVTRRRPQGGENTLHESALGYLLTGGAALPSELMLERWQHAIAGCDSIELQTLAAAAPAPSRVCSGWNSARRCWNRKAMRRLSSVTGRWAVSVRWHAAPAPLPA
jgi:exodeoxyribonuclease V beta subunit